MHMNAAMLAIPNAVMVPTAMQSAMQAANSTLDHRHIQQSACDERVNNNIYYMYRYFKISCAG